MSIEIFEPMSPASDARFGPLRRAMPLLACLWLAFISVESIGAEAEVVFGVEGHYRVGRWTAVRVTGDGVAGDGEFDSLETRDGDGVQVKYQRPSSQSDWGYVIPGSEAAPMIVRRGQQTVASTRFPTSGSPSRGPAMIPPTMPWIVCFGDPLGVDQIGANEILGREASVAVSMPQRAAGFPDSSLGYDGVDMIMLGGSSIDLVRSLNPQQQQAITDWVREGGYLFLALGETTPEIMQAAPWLQSLLPLKEPATVRIDPSAVESFTSTQTPLETFVGARLPRSEGRVQILGRTTRRIITPLAVDYNVGFGRVTVIAADLHDDLFAQWPNRLELIILLTGSVLAADQERPTRKTRATAFDDLAGQLRATLDQFSVKRGFAFSVVSLILMALIAAIGPLDYLVINRVFGRPLLGWFSFPLVTIGLSAILVFQARPLVSGGGPTGVDSGPLSSQMDGAADETIRCNRIEVFDIDSVEGTARGFAASYLYSHDAARFDVRVGPSPTLSSMSDHLDHLITTPFGYPGESFGGIQIAIEDARLPVYTVAMGQGDSLGAAQGSVLRGLPLASRSSKGLGTFCRFQPKLAEVSLEHRPGSELLQGALINPLPVDLLDGMLVYRNWAYLLPTRFPAGGRIASVDSLRQKNFRWQLSRQRALESASESEAWDPTNNASLERVAEMLMFHDSVGGERYTTLQHDPLSFLDLSHVLAEDRCILVGRVAGDLTQLETTQPRAAEADSAGRPGGKRLSLIRVVIPVTDTDRL